MKGGRAIKIGFQQSCQDAGENLFATAWLPGGRSGVQRGADFVGQVAHAEGFLQKCIGVG
jgi:hypothetical protein